MKTEPLTLSPVPAGDVRGLRVLGQLIASDSFADDFQTLGQYRAALLAEVCHQLGAARPPRPTGLPPTCWACGVNTLPLSKVTDGHYHCEECGPRP